MPDSSGQKPQEVQDLDALLEKSRRVRRRYEGRWYLQLAYYQGRQWIGWDGARLYDVMLEPWQVKLVDNRIQPIVRTEIAKMTKSRPAFVATPRTAEEEDVRAALVAERVLEFEWTELDLQRKQRQALLWSRICGAGFLKVCWDSQRGDMLEVFVGPEGDVLKDSNGRPMSTNRQDVRQIIGGMPDEVRAGIKTKRIHMGDVHVEVRTPFEIYPDPLAAEEGIESAEWVIEEAVRSPGYVEERYGVELEPDAEAVAGIAESRLPGIGTDTAGGNRDGVLVRELWMKPCGKHPRGRHVVWAGGRVLREEHNPYPWLPYVMFRGVPVPGRFWPSSVTEQLISPQTELNKRRAQIAENAQRIGNPPLMKSRQANVEWTGLPGEEVVYDDTMPNSLPQFLQVPEMPGYVREDIQRIEASMREIAGQHEVSSGTVPAGVTAASAINLLQEADDTRLGPDIADMEAALAGLGRRVLDLVGMYYTDQRVVKIAGDDGSWEIFPFRGSMLTGHADINVQAGSAMPRSKAAKQAAMQELLNLVLQYGVPVKPRDLRKFFADYEVAGLERMFSELGTDERQVQRENRRLGVGEPVQINSYDDDQVHVDGHTEWFKTPEFESRPEHIKAAAIAHVEMHKRRMSPPPMTGPDGMPIAPAQNGFPVPPNAPVP